MRLVGLGAAIGLPAAGLAALFLALVTQLQHWLWRDLPSDLGSSTPPWYLVIGLPVVGALLVIAARRLLPGDGGNPPLQGFAGEGATPLAYGPGIALAALATLGFGAVLGPEMPLVALGSVAGTALGRAARLPDKQTTVLALSGSFAAISALFGGPIVGGLLMLEGGLAMGAALEPVLIPGFVAAAIGYVLFVGLGNWGGIHEQSLTVPGLPAYHGTNVPDLFVAVAVGIVGAVLIARVRAGAGRVAADGPPRLGMPGLLVVGGLVVGLLAQTASWLGADSQDVLFSGQSSIPSLVSQTSTKIVLILLVAKALGYSISLGSGFRGGPVFPAVFLGVAVAMLPVVWFGVSPTLAVGVGAAAGTAAGTRLLLTPMVLGDLLIGSVGADAIPAVVLASVAAWITVTALDRRKAAVDTPAPAAA